MANAVGEIWNNTNIVPPAIFHVCAGEKQLIPAAGFGGETQGNIINALIQCGAVERRQGVGAQAPFTSVAMIRALESMPEKAGP